MALLMISAFTHVSAMTPLAKTAELTRTFDNLNFSLNVEWDQKDQAFFDASLDTFEKDIAEMQKQGMTNEELIDFTMSKIKDEKTKKEVEAIVKTVNDSKMSSEETRAFVVSKLSSTYANGASWSGGRIGVKLCLLLAVILILCLCNDNDDDDREPNGPEYPCYEWNTQYCYPTVAA